MSHQHHGKKPYLTAAHAIVDARMLSLQDGEDCIAYPCEFCPHWHVGHYQRLRTQIGVTYPDLYERVADRLIDAPGWPA
ncbi:hypothetical protein [Rhodococcus sp. A5(2022)]|uniref:hypothetical protein n=1 Tax=Rhodococcus sp. A5(2022) TaxID=3003588 RepID=UPI0022A88A60|nr:hypothetical protein [Rhodococcus sp. A5(2022)]MCZ1075072.1 hypothetical protein [Rhodococcus sp. A5(2022)]